MTGATKGLDQRMVREAAESASEHEAWLWVRAVVTTGAAWTAWVFALWLFVFVGRHMPDRAQLMLGGLVVIGAYLAARTYLVAYFRGSIRAVWSVLLVADLLFIAFAIAISSGSQSPFLPVMFMMPIVGALMYGALGGLGSGFISACAMTASCWVAARFFGGVMDPWVVSGNAIWLVTLGVTAGLMASKQRSDALSSALARLRIARVESKVSEARARLDDALAGFDGQETGPLAESVAEVRSVSESLASDETELHGLTPREFEVLELMACGLSHAAIAAELFITVRTVKEHAGHIYAKLGVKGRHEAVVAAHAKGLVEMGSAGDG